MLTWWCFEVVIADTGCGCVIWQVYHLFSWIIRQFKCCRRKELWDGIIFFPHVKCGSVYPVVKGETKEALKHLFLTFTEQLPSWATETLAGHFTQLDIFLSKKDYSTAAVVCQYVSALWLTNCPDCSPPPPKVSWYCLQLDSYWNSLLYCLSNQKYIWRKWMLMLR